MKVLNALKVLVAGVLAAAIIRLLYASIRWKREGDYQKFKSFPTGFVLTFWHGRMVMMPRLYRQARKHHPQGAYMLISQHGDGRIIASAVRILGIRSVAGSSSRGGRQALLGLIARGREGADLGFTPDGPRGPRYVCKDGVVMAAQATDLPVYPVTYSVDRKWQLRSWDGMIIPKPFSRGVFIVGEPIYVRDDDEREAATVKIQEVLNEITERADTYWTAAQTV
jgi:lysophospholipid acyltransferase (LPLAT)-like uncharacterized protein